MNIKELKKMIAEEYSAYTKQVKEQDMGMDMPSSPNGMEMPSIDVGADDIKVGGKEEDPLATLKDIFDMLKDFFEGDDKPAAPKSDNKKDDKADDKKDDKKDDKEDDKEEIKEGGCYGEDGKPMPESHCMEENTQANLQERFQKLANIIK